MKTLRTTQLILLLLALALSGCSLIWTIEDTGGHPEELEDSSHWDRGGVESW